MDQLPCRYRWREGASDWWWWESGRHSCGWGYFHIAVAEYEGGTTHWDTSASRDPQHGRTAVGWPLEIIHNFKFNKSSVASSLQHIQVTWERELSLTSWQHSMEYNSKQSCPMLIIVTHQDMVNYIEQNCPWQLSIVYYILNRLVLYKYQHIGHGELYWTELPLAA